LNREHEAKSEGISVPLILRDFLMRFDNSWNKYFIFEWQFLLLLLRNSFLLFVYKVRSLKESWLLFSSPSGILYKCVHHCWLSNHLENVLCRSRVSHSMWQLVLKTRECWYSMSPSLLSWQLLLEGPQNPFSTKIEFVEAKGERDRLNQRLHLDKSNNISSLFCVFSLSFNLCNVYYDK
jgi:hypothetical protein